MHAGPHARTNHPRLHRPPRHTRRRRSLQCSLIAGSRIRPRPRAVSRNRTGHGAGNRARRSHHRLHLASRILRPFHSGDKPRHAGAHRLSGVLRGLGNSRPFTKPLAHALVSGQQPPRCPTHDPHEHWPLQRPLRLMAPLHPLLKEWWVSQPSFELSSRPKRSAVEGPEVAFELSPRSP